MTIQELSKKYDLVKDDYWFHKPSNQWIIKHDAVEKIATKEGIKLVNIETLNSEVDLVRFITTMSLPNGGQIKSIGEADRSNCFSQYLGCMAEKRGIDRCVLKGIIEDESELTGMQIIEEIQNTSKNPKYGLICPLCKKGVLDQRVEYGDGSMRCPKSKNGKNLPAFKCVDNDDFKNPTCKFASWELTKEKANIEVELEDSEETSTLDLPLAVQ